MNRSLGAIAVVPMAFTVCRLEAAIMMALVGVMAAVFVNVRFAAPCVRTVIVDGWNQPAPDDVRNQCDLGGVAGQYASHGRAF